MPVTYRTLLAAGLLAWAIAAPAALAQDVPPGPEPRRIQAGRTEEALRIDGRLDEAAWAGARFVSGFLQKDPVEGADATAGTEIAVAFDDEALYIGARMRSGSREEIRDLMTRRDNPGNSERVIISLDTYRDRRTAYTFGVTAAGVRFDYYHPTDSEFNRDYSFDPVWEAATVVGPEGWTAELRIPFSQLRFNAADDQVWGINVNRYIPSRNEDTYWVLVPKNETGWASRFGELAGIQGMRPSRRLELMPYGAATTRLTGRGGTGDPFDDGYNFEARAGADLKMGLGPSLTLDATINPDFGQVEADPAVVNLSAVETFFDERRPFFTEGANLLRGAGASYFYSRRIGAAPRGFASGDYVDRPLASTILGAAKVTGRLSSGLSVGVLAALTGAESARTFDTLSGARGEVPVAPASGYGVVRLQQEFGPSASTVGLSLTGVRRDVDDGSALAALHARTAFAGGADWTLRFNGGAYEFGGAVGFSHVAGDSTVLARIQRNATHYLQRPDQDHVRYDPGRTSLNGYFAALRFNKNSGRHWLYSASVSAESPGFEINDAGRLGTADDIDAFASLRYRETQPGRLFRNYSLALFGFAGWNFGGIRQYTGLDFENNLTFNNFMGSHLSLEVFPSALSDGLTRGGPLMRDPASMNVNGSLASNYNAATSWRVNGFYGWDELGGWSYRVSGGVVLRPSSRIELSVDPTYFREVNARQYVTQRANGPAATFGTRYIFGTIGQSTVSARFRLNYAVSPELTLELYAEPFAASGQYYRLGELARPRTSDLRRYGTDGSTVDQAETGAITITDGADQFTLAPNFNVLSFRSNLVVRWEWRPGSTVFFVWQQNRADAGHPLGRATPGSLARSLSAEGINFVALKVSYWIPVR